MKIVILTQQQVATLAQWFAIFSNEKPMAVFKKGWKDPEMGITAPRDSRHFKLAKKLFGENTASLFTLKN